MDDFEKMLFGATPEPEPEIMSAKPSGIQSSSAFILDPAEIKILGTVTGRIPNPQHNQPPFALDVNAIKPAPPEFVRPAPRVVPPRGAGETNRIHCVHCFRSWSGKTVAHCSACHETFSGVSLFDAHRREDGPHGYCLKPAAFKNMEFRDGMWRSPEMTDEQKRAIWGR